MSPYQRILCPVDGSPTSNRGVHEAIRLAVALQAQLRFFHVVDLHPLLLGDGTVPVAPDLVGTMRRGGEEILAQALQSAREAGAAAETGAFEALGTRVSDAIIDEARRWGADLIVLGTHGRRGVRRLLLGSDAEAIVRHAPAAVLLVRAPEETSPEAAGSAKPGGAS